MEFHFTLIILGGLFAIGLVADTVGRFTPLPRVTLLILLGVSVGPTGFDILPTHISAWFEFLTAVALSMVAFLLGGSLTIERLQRLGRQILVISLAVVAATIVIVSFGLMAIGVPPVLALILSGIATATDPAATLDVIRETRAKGSFVEALKGIVAIDDVWGLIVFSFMLAALDVWTGNNSTTVWQRGLWELFGSCAIGAAIGFPAAFLSGRLRAGEPMQIEALAIVFLCAGVSIWMEVSYLLAGIVCGAIVTNFARHHTRPFHEIEYIEQPFMILFFFMAGASLHIQHDMGIGLIVIGCIILRIIARIIGGWAGGVLSRARQHERRWMGMALMPQAGVAIGMALVAGNYYPAISDSVLTITIMTTVIFEILGPLATRISIRQVDKHLHQNPETGGAAP